MSFPLRPGRRPGSSAGKKDPTIADLNRHPDLKARYERELKSAGCCNRSAITQKYMALLSERG